MLNVWRSGSEGKVVKGRGGMRMAARVDVGLGSGVVWREGAVGRGARW